ncbi:SigE family RNA polymerase sigma factor [Kineococcus sp. NBC_00420]|uniref:SigE family RNA polymerase sigma factor n=1 Tax=Kineococcus sp. NBC_00420 TaxID=2903564 RepID=UPI002E1D94F5
MNQPGHDPQPGPAPSSTPHPTHPSHQQRDRDFEDWASTHVDHLLRTALFLTGDHHSAEDLLQDTLERTYLHWRRVQEPAAYARTVMARAVTDRWRRLGRRPREVTLDAVLDAVGSDQHGHRSSSTGEDAAVRYADQDEAFTALRQLSPRQRAVLVLRYYEDWTEAQIADALNCSTGTVKTQASRGLARLRQLLGTARADPPDISTSSTGTAALTFALSPHVLAPSQHPVPSSEERT